MSKIALAALAAALLATPTTLAQEAGAASSATTSNESTTSSDNAAATTEAEPGVQADMALAAVEDETMTEDVIAEIGADATVRVVRLSELQAGNTAVTVEIVVEAAKERAEWIAKLQAAVAANATLNAALTEAGVESSAVIGVSRAEDGSVLIFVDDSAAMGAGAPMEASPAGQ